LGKRPALPKSHPEAPLHASLANQSVVGSAWSEQPTQQHHKEVLATGEAKLPPPPPEFSSAFPKPIQLAGREIPVESIPMPETNNVAKV